MTLYICLIHNVQPEMVKHGIHLGLVRIMACTYRVQVVLLEHYYVRKHRLQRYGTTV